MTQNQKRETSDWKRMRFKENKVWLAIGSDGKPLVQKGKVLIKYQLNQDYEYWVNQKSVTPIEASQPGFRKSKKKTTDRKSPKRNNARLEDTFLPEALDENCIHIFTDGASSGNPGPSGIGVLLQYGRHEKEISKYLGIATNNIAELKAIEAALQALKHTHLPVRIFTDSSYAFGVLVKNWKARKNQDIVNSIRQRLSEFKDLKIIKVRGHAGHKGNERADFLATSAIKAATKTR